VCACKTFVIFLTCLQQAREERKNATRERERAGAGARKKIIEYIDRVVLLKCTSASHMTIQGTTRHFDENEGKNVPFFSPFYHCHSRRELPFRSISSVPVIRRDPAIVVD
jgi:hypothetical protein